MARKLTQDKIDLEAIAIVMKEKRQWDEATAFVTEKVAFRMRYLIRQLRKNYWGIFDSPTDPSTGRQKTWVPLSMSIAENIVKSIDMDPKDITFRAKNPDGYAITDVTRSGVRDYLNKQNFGRMQDELERNLCIDGTVVWKTFEGMEKDGKTVKLITKNVDLLNVYIDPTEDNIQSAYRFTERSLSLPSEISRMDGWRNTDLDDLSGSTALARIDSQYRAVSTGTTAEYRDVWEMWGKMPKYFMTKDKDDVEEIDGHIVVSGLEVGGPTLHFIKENEKGLKPYEECRYSKVANRWYGVGPLERVMWLQIWLNTIMNIRINRSYITQLGLYKIRKGSGITPAMLTRLSANGAVVVNSMDDMQPLETPSGDNSSYEDERVISDWVQKVTGAYDISVGNSTPASSTATATSIQNQNGKTGFTLVKEEMGSFYKNWLDRHALPIIAKTITAGQLIRFSDNEDEFKELVQKVVAYEAKVSLEKSVASGFLPTEAVMMREMQSAEERIMKQKDFFVKLVDDIIAENLETEVVIGNSDIDTNTMIQQLTSMLPLAPEYKTPIINEVFDLMGLAKPKLPPQSAQQPQQPMVDSKGQPMNAPQGQPGNMPPVQTPQTMQQMTMGANTQQQKVNQ